MFNQPCWRNGHALLLAGDAAFSGSPKYTLNFVSPPLVSAELLLVRSVDLWILRRPSQSLAS
jgi:hypothetical protein